MWVILVAALTNWLRGAMAEGLDIHDLMQILITVGIAASFCYYVACYLGTRGFFRKYQAAGDTTLPAVTILKPLKGLDVDLYENLASFCRQDYPAFQLVLGVADRDDPAVAVVRRLQASFPDIAIDLVIDSRRYGTNHKISNLHNMYRAARHPVVVIADSDIRVAGDYLRRIVPPLHDPKVGVVTCLYRGASGDGGLPTLVECLFINTDFSPSVLVARLVETRRYAFGATIAMRRSVLDEIGGFLPLANYLADDFYLGNRVAARGYAVALSDVVVETVLAVGTWRQLFEHQLRWARTNRSSRPGGYAALLLTHGTLWATLNLFYNHHSLLAVSVTLFMYGLRMLTAGAITNGYLGAPLRFWEVALVPLKDLFSAVIWALAFFGDNVHWSGNEFRVRTGGEMLFMSPAEATGSQASAFSTTNEHDPPTPKPPRSGPSAHL